MIPVAEYIERDNPEYGSEVPSAGRELLNGLGMLVNTGCQIQVRRILSANKLTFYWVTLIAH